VMATFTFLLGAAFLLLAAAEWLAVRVGAA